MPTIQKPLASSTRPSTNSSPIIPLVVWARPRRGILYWNRMFKSGLPCFGSYHSGIIFLIAAQPKSILNFLRRVIPFSEYTKAAGFLLQKPAGVDAFLVLFQALTQNPAWISGHPPGRSAQVLAVALDDLFVPPEAVLAVTFKGTSAIVIGVHIDKTVALAQLAGRSGHQVDTGPHGVAH